MLVIIGLLIGGLFVGQSLIHNAQINAVITEFNRYQTATQAFKQQYQALPGDMNNATSFWGSAGGTGSDATCATTVSTTTATCDGNGDGTIAQTTHYGELFRAWQHLANAKMIEGSFTGSATSTAANTPAPGVNVPQSRYATNAGWSVQFAQTGLGGSEGWLFNTDYGTGHVLLFGGGRAGGVTTNGLAIPPKDAWSIDKKIDDGKPAMGNVISSETANCTNAASMSDLGTSYKLNGTTPACFMLFLANF